MAIVLLKTKLHIPPIHSWQVLLVRLFERLDAGLLGKLTLISAPAGAGKTSLISAWVRRCGLPTAWFSADRDDNDPTRFWMYFIAALQSVQDNLGREMQSYLSTSQSPAFDGLLSGLINELEEFSGRLVFVLDAFHLIESNQIHETMIFFQDHMPASMHLILSTRADPPWPLARLRAKGEMTEIRLDDLRLHP